MIKSDRYEYYNDGYMAQRIGVCDVFNTFFDEEQFDIIIEIGFYKAGFTQYLSDKVGNKLYSFDINRLENPVRLNKIESNGSHMFVENIFATDTIPNLLKQDKRILLLCDGGDKQKEVKIFRGMLKPNDVVMAHDYFESKRREKWQKALWYSCEIEAKDMDLEGLEHYNEWTETFSPVVWGIRIKI